MAETVAAPSADAPSNESAATATAPTSTTTEPVDLTSSPHSLHRAVQARRAEYTRQHRVRVKVGTWNVAACPGTDKDLATWFVSGKGLDKRLANLDPSQSPAVEDGPGSIRLIGDDEIGLYVLGLQEIVNLNPVAQYVYSDTNPTAKWKAALEAALPKGYELVTSEQMSGLLLLIYASPEIARTIGNVSTKAVGTGVGGWLGNKGAVVSRIILGETTKLVFVNCHLSSGSDTSSLDRRCWDVSAIIDRTRFDPVTQAGVMDDEPDKIGDEDFAFWFGDLNFRLDEIPGDDIRRLLMLHTRGEYDLKRKPTSQALDGEDVIVMRAYDTDEEQTDGESSTAWSTEASDDDESVSLPDPDDFDPDPKDDPASLQATLDSLLPHDQLQRVIRERKALHDGWREGPITFLPSYKYDVGTVGLFDSSDKRRAPSWCDRILYRSRRYKEEYEKKVKEEEESRKKDEEMKARGMDHATDDDDVLFDYDPDNDGETQPTGQPGLDYDEYDDGDEVVGETDGARESPIDRVHLDVYTSHQRIMSSDHKPVISIFTLDYDAIVPDLKAKVHAEVARELDRAENEGRPSITVVPDHHESSKEAPTTSEATDEVVDFGPVQYLRRKTTSLTLANTGRVSATFSFVDKPTTEENSGSSPINWLTTSFSKPELVNDTVDLGKEVTLEPGETVSAVLDILVDDLSHVRMLNDGQAKLEDVLVLRVQDGRDHFIPVRATWTPTCVGRSIDELIRVPDGGIRALVREKSDKMGSNGSIPYDLEVRWSAPKELFKLTEALETLTERVLADEQMLDARSVPTDKPGWPFESFTSDSRLDYLASVIDALDEDKSINGAFAPEVSSICRLETVSEALLQFLRGLTDGIITVPLWSRIEQAPLSSIGQTSSPSSSSPSSPEEDDRATILDILGTAPNHNICFVFLTTTLSKVISELSPVTKAELDALKSPSNPRAVLGMLGRRSLSFRQNTGAPAAGEALAALERRRNREKRLGEIFGKVVCRAQKPAKEKDRRGLEDKQRAVVELFLRRRDEG